MEEIRITDKQAKELARLERNRYQREYYKKNKEKIKEINRRHWENEGIKTFKKNKGEM